MKQHPFIFPDRARGMLEQAIELCDFSWPETLLWAGQWRKLEVVWDEAGGNAGLFDGRVHLSSFYANAWEATNQFDPNIAQQIAYAQVNFLHEAAHAYDFGKMGQVARGQIAQAWGRNLSAWWTAPYGRQIGESFARAFYVQFAPRITAKITDQDHQDMLRSWLVPVDGEKMLIEILNQGAPVLPNTAYRPRSGFAPLTNARDWVELQYVLQLGRLPDPAGWDYWAGITTTHGRDAVVAGISGTTEFMKRHGRQA